AEQQRDDDRNDRDERVLAPHVGLGTLLDGLCDVDHARLAARLPENPLHEEQAVEDGGHPCDDRDGKRDCHGIHRLLTPPTRRTTDARLPIEGSLPWPDCLPRRAPERATRGLDWPALLFHAPRLPEPHSAAFRHALLEFTRRASRRHGGVISTRRGLSSPGRLR